jgi:two-component system, sporulation sensor kinase E
MDAMHADGTLKIETRQQNHQLSIHITDCGCGIPSEMLEKIFQPFYTTKGNGTGLGLSVCASIVEQHDGHISVSSEVGVGTQFSIFLPIPQPPDVT